MNRREMIAAAAAGAMGAGLFTEGTVFAGAAKTAASGKSPLIEAALDCIGTGEICHQHCLELLSQGDKSMGDCSKTVTEMLTMCRTLVELAAQKSERLGKFAALCADACKACEKTCRVHENHHTACKDCAESCARCAAECKKVAA